MNPTTYMTISLRIMHLLLLASVNLSAQTNALNFNMNVQFESQKQRDYPYRSTTDTYIQSEKDVIFGFNPSFAYLRFTPTSNFHFFELARVGFKYDEDSYKRITPDETLIINGVSTFDLILKARYSYNVSLGSNERFQSFMGLGIVPQFQREVIEPKVSSFKTATTDLGADLELIGSAIFSLNEHLKLNVSLPVKIWNGNYEWSRVDNPAIPLRQQKNAEFKKEFFPTRFEVKVGITYQFKEKEKVKKK